MKLQIKELLRKIVYSKTTDLNPSLKLVKIKGTPKKVKSVKTKGTPKNIKLFLFLELSHTVYVSGLKYQDHFLIYVRKYISKLYELFCFHQGYVRCKREKRNFQNLRFFSIVIPINVGLAIKNQDISYYY